MFPGGGRRYISGIYGSATSCTGRLRLLVATLQRLEVLDSQPEGAVESPDERGVVRDHEHALAIVMSAGDNGVRRRVLDALQG